jgi:hypothetical protein
MLGIAASGMVPPPVRTAAADSGEFSAARAFEHIRAVAAEPRPIGSPGNAATRRYIVDQLRRLGIEPELQTIVVPDYYSPGPEVEVVNVIGRIRGTDSTGAIVLVAHYDTVPWTPGANDDAAGVAVVLETGRAILSASPLRNDVVLLLTDGEEPAPRYGSAAFADRYGSEAKVVINLEAIGGSGPSTMVEIAGPEGALISHYAEAVSRPAASSILDDVVELIGGSNTDIAPFRDRGTAAFEFAYLRGSPIYHTAGDDIDSVHLGSVQHHGMNALGLARRLGDVDLAELEGGGREVFFTLLGRIVVHYPASLGIGLVIVAGLLLGSVLLVAFRQGQIRVRRLLVGAVLILLVALGVGLGVAVVWRILVGVLWTERGPTGLAATAWMVVLAAGAVGSTLLIRARLVAHLGEVSVEWASVAAWWVAALVLGLALPGAGYLFVWPVLAAAVAAVRRSEKRWARLAALAAVSAPAIVLAVPIGDVFFQMGLPRPGNLDSQIPEVVAVTGILGSLLVVLLAPHVRRAGAE